ncbi:MAG: flavodoxin family protein [Phycisphaerae bacterium]|nr:flavodoxin family protein [Phycisphaerae bacterium]
MTEDVSRRGFLKTAGIAVAAGAITGTAAQTQEPPATGRKIRIIGLACSPRKGKTTAAAVQVALEAAAGVSPDIRTELIELAGMNIPVFDPVNPNKGDFAALEPKLADAAVAGLIIGTPVYFSGMSSLCKAFIDQCMVFRKNNFALKNKVAGVVAVGGVRNGGQELALESVQAALMCQEMIVVGDGSPTAHTGATVLNDGQDDISGDEFGLNTVRNLGRRVAEVAVRMAR